MYQGDLEDGGETALVNFFKQVLFWSIHATCIFVIWVGVSPAAVVVCFALYFIRMFAITGGFHRYFSHRTYKTSRLFQFLLGYLGTTSAQKGPIWWASHHRHHHQYSDTEEDIHSPAISGIWFAHVGWVLCNQFVQPRLEKVKDLVKYPELQWLEKYHFIPPISLAVLVYLFGAYLESAFPGLNTNGWQMLIWGFFVSTTLLYHGTFCINSFAHLIGRKRFKSGDDSKNSLILSLITLGEGWHNNHHRYPGSESQGMYWWEIDITHYILKMLSYLGIVWDIRSYPDRIYEEAKQGL